MADIDNNIRGLDTAETRLLEMREELSRLRSENEGLRKDCNLLARINTVDHHMTTREVVEARRVRDRILSSLREEPTK